MDYDNKAWMRSTVDFLTWTGDLKKHIQSITDPIISQLGFEASEPVYFSNGAFNYSFKIQVADRLDLLFRFPVFGKSAFRYEKTNYEATIMAYLSRYTKIPIPRVFEVTACRSGPFMVMERIQGNVLTTYIEAPSADGAAPPVLSPSVGIPDLTKAYRHMAKILIDLSKHRFTHIGSVVLNQSNRSKDWHVAKRPMTLNMNHLVSFANFPSDALPQHPFTTANEYFAALAEIHVIHLRTQRNDAIDDEDDCRKKYIARCLFRRIARNFSTIFNQGPFPLYCDDLSPDNLIVNDSLDLRGVVDWEYSYAAPAELTYCSPWWLLLIRPTMWEDGIDSFLEHYLPRHELFLKVLKECESEMTAHGMLSASECLSDSMADSLRNGRFWFCLAVTSSFAFDDIYWRFIDPIYYGEFTTIESRAALLSLEEQEELEPFVRLKMEQAATGMLDEHRTVGEAFDA